MEINRLELLKSVVDVYSVKFQILEENAEEGAEFDEGLRAQLYQNYDYGLIMRQLEENCQCGKLYQIHDAFGVFYIIFQSPVQEEEAAQRVIIGPYMEAGEKADAIQIVEKMGLELYQIQALKDYYYGIAAVANLDQVVYAMVRMLFPEYEWKTEKTGIALHEPLQELRVRIQSEKTLSMDIVEKRYQYENKLLEAVAQGDLEKAEAARDNLSRYRIEPRNSDNLREAKNSMIIMNVLMRKAVENAGVHPWYIDELSSAFAKRIEAARNLIDIVKINREFVRKYCLLVKNYSRKGYSEVIEDCMNYIEFNLTEELTLNNLAERFCVNPSSLSKKFKSELGQTLTDYVNQKRVKASLIFLATTKLPVGEVAEKVGYLNENYYSRIFKKLQGMSPREYRAIMTESE